MFLADVRPLRLPMEGLGMEDAEKEKKENKTKDQETPRASKTPCANLAWHGNDATALTRTTCA